ncbi:MAG: histidinol-phosphate transaminase [bacterium]
MMDLPYRNLAPRKAIPSYWNPPADQPDRLYLHLGESPFPPTEEVRKAICEAAGAVNFYPDTNAALLREDLARYVGYGICPENILAGNGSDDLIQLVVQTFLPKGGTIVSFEPTFFYYKFCTIREGERYSPLFRKRAAGYDLPPMDQVRSHLQQEKPDIVFLANPNNPTGGLVDRDRVMQLIECCPGIAVVDECYFEFSGQTVIDCVQNHPNLIVLRSLSKSFSLAGVRIGYAVSCRDRIEAMERMALTFPVNAIAQAAARAALRDTDTMRRRVTDLIEWREELARQLKALGLEVFASHTNFLLLSSGRSIAIPDGCALSLAKQGILVSDQSNTPGIEGFALRITVGRPDQMERFVREIGDLIS